MLSTTMLLVGLCSSTGPALDQAGSSDSLVKLYQGGKTWQEFFDGARARRETWKENYQIGQPAPEAVARARAVPGSWRVLVVAEDWCGDSANTIPYLVRLVEQVPSLELRIVNSTVGRWVMVKHPTPDGRAATPTVVILDADGAERGCFVERPAALRAWAADNRGKLDDDGFQKGKMAWYRNDRGRATVADFVALLESAGGGGSGCG